MYDDNNNNKNGGKVLASGGFGCVFTPALKCVNKSKRESNKISKLMTSKYAKEEYDELKYLNTKLYDIPNYKNYFLINDFTLCKPAKLTKSDLKNYGSCKALIRDNITVKNINDSLDKVLSLNIPYGGTTIEEFMISNKNYEQLIEMNKKLLDLFKNGIAKMNQKHIYHSDIKASNILILNEDETNITEMKVRLIDWSLTVEYIPFKNNTFPKNWKNRPLQFNVPFSIILFTDLFYERYLNFIKKNKELYSNTGTLLRSKRAILYEFMKEYLYLWMKERGYGHYKYINKIFYMLFKYDILETNDYVNDNNMIQFIEENYTLPYIINYLVEIVIHFIKIRKDGSLNVRDYLDTIFIKIIDIWGFLISYLPLYELLFENYKNLTNYQKELFINLRSIFLKYLYNPHIQVIKIENLENNIKKLIK
jgi:hypothetical protein